MDETIIEDWVMPLGASVSGTSRAEAVNDTGAVTLTRLHAHAHTSARSHAHERSGRLKESRGETRV